MVFTDWPTKRAARLTLSAFQGNFIDMSEPLILDQWGNASTGLNSLRKDKRATSFPIPEELLGAEAFALYQATTTAQIIVDLPATHATKAWLDVSIQGDEETAEEIGAALEDFKLPAKVLDGLRKQRLFGGGAIFVNVLDGNEKDLSLPLNEKGLQEIVSLVVLEPDECAVTAWNGDFTSEHFGEPLYYTISPKVIGAGGLVASLTRVHASRVLRFIDPTISRLTMNSKRGWGRSALDAVWPAIRNFDIAFESASALLADFAQAVYKLKGLTQALAADKMGLVKERLEIIDYSRSVFRAIALDADMEDFERKSTPLTGMPEILDRFCNHLAMAARIPVTRLMGQAPAGLNATGDSDERNFHDFIESIQVTVAQPPIERLIKLLMISKQGPTKGVEPENWCVKWRPLAQESEKSKADTRLVMAQADNVYLTAGVLGVDEVREARFAGDHFSVDTSVEAESADESSAADLADTEGVTRVDPVTGEAVQTGGAQGAIASAHQNVQATALNGAQVTSALAIVTAFNAGEVSRESAIAMLESFFQLEHEAADAIVGVKMEIKPDPVVVAPGAKPPAKAEVKP